MAAEDEQLRIIKNLQEKVEELQKDRWEIKCFNCGEMGHIAKKCKQPQKKEDNNRRDFSCYNCGEGFCFSIYEWLTSNICYCTDMFLLQSLYIIRKKGFFNI